MTGSSLKLCVRWLHFIQDSWILWKIGHGLTSEQCPWFVWFLKHRKMLRFGNQVEKNKHTLKQHWAESESDFSICLCEIFITFISLANTAPMLEILWCLFSCFLGWWENSACEAKLARRHNHPRTGDFQWAFQKLAAMTNSTIYSLAPYHGSDRRP